MTAHSVTRVTFVKTVDDIVKMLERKNGEGTFASVQTGALTKVSGAHLRK